MKRRFTKILALLLTLTVTSLGISGCVENGNIQTSLATWMWGETLNSGGYSLGNDYLGNPEKLNTFIQFAQANGIDRVYFYTDIFIPPADFTVPPEARIFPDPNAVRVFDPCTVYPEGVAQAVRALHNAGITVEALSGTGEWINPLYQWEQVDRINSIMAYQANYSADPSALFDAIHLDVELWADQRYASQPAVVMNDMVDLIELAKNAAGPLPVNGDMAATWDSAVTITRGDTTKEAWKFIVDAYDGITFMSYFDNRTMFHQEMEAELAYLNASGSTKPVWISYGFDEGVPSWNTLIDNTYEEFTAVRSAIDEITFSNDFVTGHAVHNYLNFGNWLAAQGAAPEFEPLPFTLISGENKAISPSVSMNNPVQVKLNIVFPYDYVFIWNGTTVVETAGRVLRVEGKGYASDVYAGSFTEHVNGTWGRVGDSQSNLSDGVSRTLTLEEGESYKILLFGYDSRASQWTINANPYELNVTVPTGYTLANGNTPVEITLHVGALAAAGRSATPHLSSYGNAVVANLTQLQSAAENYQVVLVNPEGVETSVSAVSGSNQYVFHGLAENLSTSYTLQLKNGSDVVDEATVLVKDGSVATVALAHTGTIPDPTGSITVTLGELSAGAGEYQIALLGHQTLTCQNGVTQYVFNELADGNYTLRLLRSGAVVDEAPANVSNGGNTSVTLEDPAPVVPMGSITVNLGELSASASSYQIKLSSGAVQNVLAGVTQYVFNELADGNYTVQLLKSGAVADEAPANVANGGNTSVALKDPAPQPSSNTLVVNLGRLRRGADQYWVTLYHPDGFETTQNCQAGVDQIIFSNLENGTYTVKLHWMHPRGERTADQKTVALSGGTTAAVSLSH